MRVPQETSTRGRFALLFSYAFRPLFLLVAVYAIVVIPVWVAAWLGLTRLPAVRGNPIAWHSHEMVYGFAGAAVAGFALTAVATWTKRPPVSGFPLFALCTLWLLARALFAFPSGSSFWLAAFADLAFGALLVALMGREVFSARNERNYKVVTLLALFVGTNVAFYVSVARGDGLAMQAILAGLWSVIFLVNLVGGRIIPAFTANWLRRQAEAALRRPEPLPKSFDKFDSATTWLLAAFAILQLSAAAPRATAALGLLTSVMLVARLARWQGQRTLREPIVWILHLAFAWIPVGVFLLSAAALGFVPRTAGFHALAVGAIATMILAVAGRAALGHTGRPLASHPLVTAAYLSIGVAAVVRVAASSGTHPRVLLIVSAVAWTLGFSCFAWRYVPILVGASARTTMRRG